MQAQANMNMGMPNCSILFIEYDTQRVNNICRKKANTKKYGREMFLMQNEKIPEKHSTFLTNVYNLVQN